MILTGIKTNLTSHLNKRYHLDNLKMDSPPVLAASLDPRFRKLSFLSDAERDKVQEIIVEKASSSSSKSDEETASSPSSQTDEPPKKKKKLSVLDRLLGEDMNNDDESSVTEEVACYFQERPIKRSEDPFAWWRGNANRFPHLAVLARHYLAIPATSTPSERVFSVAGIVVDKRRCALTAEMIDALVFLHKNRSLLGLTDEVPVQPGPKLILQAPDSNDDDEDEEEDDMPALPDLPNVEQSLGEPVYSSVTSE